MKKAKTYVYAKNKGKDPVKEVEKGRKVPLKKELADLNPPLTPQQIAAVPYTYINALTFAPQIANELWAEKTAKALVEWVTTTPNAIKINEFLALHHILKADFNEMRKKFPVLERANQFALGILGNIRERNLLERHWDSGTGQYMMNLYDEDWKAETDRRDAIKLKEKKTEYQDLVDILSIVAKPIAPTEEVARSLKEKGSNESRTIPGNTKPTATTDIPSKGKTAPTPASGS